MANTCERFSVKSGLFCELFSHAYGRCRVRKTSGGKNKGRPRAPSHVCCVRDLQIYMLLFFSQLFVFFSKVENWSFSTLGLNILDITYATVHKALKNNNNNNIFVL